VKIAVFGAGGVGGYFGGRLAAAGTDVHLIARGRHLDALRRRGLRVRSIRGDFAISLPATDDPSDVGASDAVLLCVKAFDTDAAAARLGPLLGPETVVVSVQNGIDNEERIGTAIGAERVLGGVALAFICAQAGMTATTRLPPGEIRASAPAWSMFRRIVAEVAALAAAEGVRLDEDVLDRLAGWAERLEPSARSSLHDDLVAGRRMELDELHGAAVRRAAAHGLELPACEAVLAVLAPWATRARQAA
jgi:ketopantoate reductase